MTDLYSELGAVDIAFVLDTTGSMQPFIDEARRRIREISERVAKEGDLDLRFALVEYRDHPPQDSTFVTRIYPFGDAVALETTLASLIADGGGDGPEAVWDGLEAAANSLGWRPHADKRAFLIGDSPPHGESTPGDGFADGCPCGLRDGGLVELYGFKGIMLHAISLIGYEPTTKAFARVAEGVGGTCEVAKTPAAMSARYATTTAGTSSAVAGSRAYSSAVAASASAGRPTDDASIAAGLGWSVDAVTGTRTYLARRGIDPTLSSSGGTTAMPPDAAESVVRGRRPRAPGS